MTHNCIEIKNRKSDFVGKGVLWLFLSVCSALCASLPLLTDVGTEKETYFFVLGGVSFLFFASMFISLLFRTTHPANALVLNSHGFKICESLGISVEIEWANVSAIGLFGTKKSPLFGIRLENTDIVISQLKRKAADEMRSNLDENLPAILIPQSEIHIPVAELKELFSKFIRESRALDGGEVVKPKVNPYKSEDVIRAFGHISETEPGNTAGNAATLVAEPPVRKPAEKASSADADSFYASLREKISSSPVSESISSNDTVPADNNNTVVEDVDESINDEVLAILSKAKSTKITELEKLLSKDNTPYTPVSLKEPEQTAFQPPEPEKADVPLFVTTDIEEKHQQSRIEPDILFPDNKETITTISKPEPEPAVFEPVLIDDEPETEQEQIPEVITPEVITPEPTITEPVPVAAEPMTEQEPIPEIITPEPTIAEPVSEVNKPTENTAVPDRAKAKSSVKSEHDDDYLAFLRGIRNDAEALHMRAAKAAGEKYPEIVVIDNDDAKTKNKKKHNPTDFFFVADIEDDNTKTKKRKKQ